MLTRSTDQAPFQRLRVIDKDLLEILACPETHQSLTEAGKDLLATVNERIAAGSAVNKGGESLSDALEAALVREDGKLLYPIRDGIPVLLIDEGIEI
jgi:uncharacterized protein YbaR (Trm112 family)